jgi:hypothetical protein
VNHHLQNVFFGSAFLLNERIESYEWLFRTFLNVMGGKALTIKTMFPDTIHRFCMWHIMEKVDDKVGPPTTNF